MQNIPQQNIEDQQVDFRQKVLGAENHYVKAPLIAHSLMFIPDELFEARQKLLLDAFNATSTHPGLIDKWLNLDESFRRVLVKNRPWHVIYAISFSINGVISTGLIHNFYC
ncbi:hypothetical protein [Colwellia piezophila]|uniref:hypothetical protein n=1 Tax=Colwellia piezophila TaxID=211668 RepID=UPI000372B431|nr:hypothetical protein [Colwellia piezophila]